MAEQGQERTEEATPRRQQQAREKGQVPRSRELTTALLTLGGGAALIALGPSIIEALLGLMRAGFAQELRDAFDPTRPAQAFGHALWVMLKLLAPFLLLMWVLAVVTPALIGGWNFSTEAMGFKWDRLDPLAGLKRVVSVRGLVELLKALAKFALVALVAVVALQHAEPELLGLSAEPLPRAIAHTGATLADLYLWIAAPLLLIAAIDVPYQLWQNAKELKMTLQEVKDEMKDTEGRPEIKGKLRRLQMEFAQRRMMDKVPTADVVIINPTHYAVALKYDGLRMSAPLLVAAGLDEVALRIRALAASHGVPLVESPLLARAIYYNARLDRAIPTALYTAVAQVLAYVFQLRAERALPLTPIGMPEVPVPPELRTE